MVDQEEHPSVTDPEGWAAAGREWAAQHTAAIGENVARWRGRRRLSAQRLADRCRKLGMPSLSRTVITKLENGRKEAVSTAELVILATALEVPPAVLMFPIGERDTVETTPGVESAPLDAIFWFAGLRADIYGEAEQKGTALDFFIMHRRIVDALLGQYGIWYGYESRYRSPQPIEPHMLIEVTRESIGLPPLPQEVEIAREMEQNASYLRTTRDAIRKLGLAPPPLPAELAYIDRKETSDGVD
jgi:transcriptional regulator with XRE-family HTH domain